MNFGRLFPLYVISPTVCFASFHNSHILKCQSEKHHQNEPPADPPTKKCLISPGVSHQKMRSGLIWALWNSACSSKQSFKVVLLLLNPLFTPSAMAVHYSTLVSANYLVEEPLEGTSLPVRRRHDAPTDQPLTEAASSNPRETSSLLKTVFTCWVFI